MSNDIGKTHMSPLTKVTGQHVTVLRRMLWWLKHFLNYQPNTHYLSSLWQSIRPLGSSMTHQQRISSLEPLKPQESFANLLPDMGSSHQQRPTSGPSTRTQAPRKTIHAPGVLQSLQIVHIG